MTTQREPRIERSSNDDRTDYLTEQRDWGVRNRVSLGANEVAVFSYRSDPYGVRLVIDGGPFSLHKSLTLEEARLLGKALLLAADEVESGQPRGDEDDVARFHAEAA